MKIVNYLDVTFNLKTNIGRCIFRLINKHFPPEHKFYKSFDRNTLKLSSSCVSNLKKLNKQLQSKHTQKPILKYPQNLELSQERESSNERLMFYRKSVTVTCDKENYTKLYKGICETTLEKRYANHKRSFNVSTYENDTKLCTEYWFFKTMRLNPKVSWQIKRRYKSYNLISRSCNLCLNDKL